MGNFPQIGQPAAIPIRLPTPSHFMDHHFLGQPVLPAVEAMEALARVVVGMHPHVAVNHMVDIRFDKFLPMDPVQAQLEAVVELQLSSSNQWQAALITRTKAPKAAISRSKVHARLSFSQSGSPEVQWPLDVAAVPEGICRSVPPEKIYADLVPFGPAFRNIVSPVYISPDGALSRIKTPAAIPGSVGQYHLGSPYALDAAMHGACVWSQHFKGIVAFPVGIEARMIIKPTLPGRIYYGRVRPAAISDHVLTFDIALLDEQGGLCEMVHGVQMRDVSGGRLQPPGWIIGDKALDPLARIGQKCLGLTVVESEAMAPFAVRGLTSLEAQRYMGMGARRQKSFLAARLALKRLYRRCSGEEFSVPAHGIETIYEKSPLPRCFRTDAADVVRMYCSVSHDRRFTVAVAHGRPVGLDVEMITGKALKSGRIFMASDERQLAERSHLGAPQAALRIWSIKEAVAKAFGMNLAEAWQLVRVTRIGEQQSGLTVDGKPLTAHHVQVDEHLVSLIVRP